MFDLQRMCIAMASLLIYSVVLIFVVTKYYETSKANVYKVSPYTKFVEYGGSYSNVKTGIQKESRRTQSKKNLDYERLREKYKNEDCPIRNLTRSHNSTKRTGLLSFPASGNTWTRHLIQQLTGFPTSGAGKLPIGCIVYKSHTSTKSAMASFDKAIIIIRNPLYSLKSYFHYKYGEQGHKKLSERTKVERHMGYANTSLFVSPKWTSHVAKEIPHWKNSYISWFKYFKRNTLVIVYENLKQNVLRELERIIQFLEIELNTKDLWCTLVNQEGDYHRIPQNLTATSVFTLFTTKQKKDILRAVCEVSNVARNMGIYLNISQYVATLSETPNTTCS